MQTLIKFSDFYPEDSKKYMRAQGIVDYINALKDGMYADQELDENLPEAQNVYFADGYLAQVNNGGLYQYFFNTDFNPKHDDLTLKALTAIQAFENIKLFNKAREIYLSMMKEENDKVYDEKSRQLENLNDEFFYLKDNIESIPDLCFIYIETIKNLKIIEDAQYEQALKEILALVPYAERKKLAEEYRANKIKSGDIPRYEKVAIAICEKYHLNFLGVNAIDHGDGIVSDEQAEINVEEGIFFYHLSTEQGYYFIADYGTVCDLVNGENGEVVARENI